MESGRKGVERKAKALNNNKKRDYRHFIRTANMFKVNENQTNFRHFHFVCLLLFRNLRLDKIYED